MTLNPKHKLFCDEYLANGFNATVAYKTVYKTKNDKVAGVNAARLLGSASVQEQLKQEKAKLAEKSQITKEKLLEDLQMVKKMSLSNPIRPNYSAFVSATAQQSKMLGFDAPSEIRMTSLEDILKALTNLPDVT